MSKHLRFYTTSLLSLWLLCCSALVLALDARQLQTLNGDDADAKVEVIGKLAADASPQAAAVLLALNDGNLLSDAAGKIYIQQDAVLLDALSGAKVLTTPEGLDKISINNRLRRELEGALAAIKLAAPDVATRRAAVEALKDSATPEMLPRLTQRWSQETDPQIKQLLDALIARLNLASSDAKVRENAAQLLGESGDPQIKSLLEAAVASETDASAKAAMLIGIHTIEQQMKWGELAGNLFTGLSLGSILLLAALGLAITYGLLGVINMAHGEMLMVGAYTTYILQGVFSRYFPASLDWYLLAALPCAFLATALLGILLERLVIRHLYGRPLETLLATWGISLALMQSVRMLFGAQNVTVANPSWMSGAWQLLPNLALPYNRMIIIGFSLAVLVFMWLLINKTRLGLFVRAVTQNRAMAGCVGVSTPKIDMLAFGLGSGIAGLAGVALSQIGNVGPDLGQAYIVDSFMVVVLGGVGQLAGTVVAALGLGVLAKFLEPQTGAVLAKIAILVLIVMFIQKRPQGMFALKGRFVEQ